MRRREAAFSLIELMIALAIVMTVLFAAINFFAVSVRQYKVQTKITESNLEGILGLELFRQDLESMGVGLPWHYASPLSSFSEATGNGAALNDSASDPPRPVVSLNGPSFTVNQSDYLVVKSSRVGMSDAAGKWTTLTQANMKRSWTPDRENLSNNDYVIVLALGSTDANRRTLVTSGDFYTQYNNTVNFVPVEPFSANIVYGIDNVAPVRPFNRADYYIDNVSVPRHCASNTGVLVKAVISHDASGTPVRFPLIDCAADMQVVYGLDNNADGVVDSWADDISVGKTAADIRSQVVEVHVHILAQEGQRDDSYRTPTDNISVGSEGYTHPIDVSGYRNYRWKVYNIVVKPKNLAQ